MRKMFGLPRDRRSQPAEIPQWRDVRGPVDSPVKAREPPTSQPIDRTATELTHGVHRQVVHRAAVDQHFAVVHHWGQHARYRNRGAEPAPQRSPTVHVGVTGGQVR